MGIKAEQPAIFCQTEYDPLKHVIVVSPKYMAITEVINETQRHYAKENINIEKALEQHRNFIDILQSEGVLVEELPPKGNLNEQVFTRDIGFTIGHNLFVSSMEEEIRQKEVTVLMKWLNEKQLPYTKLELPTIEGGDVIIDNNLVWVGVSGRTTRAAIKELDTALPDYEVIAVPLRDNILHLDCVFNVINEDTALVYPEAIDQEVMEKIQQKYKVIEITKEEQFLMGSNVLAIGKDKLISLPENKRLNQELRNAGFQIIEVPFSEIIKSGGCYRCCTLPLIRK